MSAEAWRAVFDRSTARGAELLALLALADASPDRSGYPKASLPFSQWCKMCRCSERQLKRTVADLLAHGRLFLVSKGGGRTSNLYEIPVQIYMRGVAKPYPLGVSKTPPLNRERPLEHDSRADLHSTGTPLRKGTEIVPMFTYPPRL